MPVTALSARSGRHTARPAHPAALRVAGKTTDRVVIRRPAEPPPPALTLTVNIPLTGDALSPQAHRLIEAVRDLIEHGDGEVSAAEPAVPAGTGPEVRLLTASRRVAVDGEVLPLTRLEFDLLLFLADNPRRVFTRAQLLTGVWGYEHTGERTVDVHVRRLRVKLGPAVPLITTVYGVGYRLADDARIVVLEQG
jgi:two-component system, OmpR family, response regulator